MTAARDLVLDREHSRMVDRIAMEQYGMSGLVLMENAGRGCAEHILRRNVDGEVLICCGPGNNGGDGFVMARHLANAGVDIRVLLNAEPMSLSADARVNHDILAKTETVIEYLGTESESIVRRKLAGSNGKKVVWIVDALLGTGSHGAVRPGMAFWIRLVNESPVPKLAVDLPSGLDCDTGQPNGICVEAAETCTLVALKPCFRREPGRRLSGHVSVIDIGIPQEITKAVEALQRKSGAIDFDGPKLENA